MRNKSIQNVLFNQTLKAIENIYRDVGGYDMSYDGFITNAKNHGKRIKIISVLKDLKREKKIILYF